MNDIDPLLLKRYASGECTDEEVVLVEHWLASGEVESDPGVFKDMDDELLKQEIWDRTGFDQTLRKKSLIRRYSYQIAAACLLLIFLAGYGGYHLYLNNKQTTLPAYSSLRVAAGRRITVTLADGTVVYINGDSKLNYPLRFSEKGQRIVYLSGEAHFKVAKDPLRPFIIYAGGSRTHVLGTVFNLRAYPEQRGAVVTVEEGRVQFSSDSNSTAHLILTAGKQGTYQLGHPLRLQQVYTAGFTAWKDSRMFIKKQNLGQIALLIRRWYGVDVQIHNPELLSERFTGVYNNLPLSILAKDISKAFHCTYKLDQKTLTFY
jgi:transmembrane sensor